MRRQVVVTLALAVLPVFAGDSARLAAQVPQPFPRPPAQGRPAPATPPPSTTPSAPAPPPSAGAQPASPAEGPPTETSLGFPLYPNSQFITSYDAGHGQRYYLFGSSASFPELVKYYQAVLKTKGTLVFETPATQMFEAGRFDEKSMAFPPGITIKDYTWGGSGGYLNPARDAKPERFPSIIQVVPAAAGGPR